MRSQTKIWISQGNLKTMVSAIEINSKTTYCQVQKQLECLYKIWVAFFR